MSPADRFASARSSNLPYENADGSANLNLKHGRYTTEFKLNRPGSPRAKETLAGLERRFFEVCCDAPELDFKPRANLQKHFWKYNTPADHGPMPLPSARTRANETYQANCFRNPNIPY